MTHVIVRYNKKGLTIFNVNKVSEIPDFENMKFAGWYKLSDKKIREYHHRDYTALSNKTGK